MTSTEFLSIIVSILLIVIFYFKLRSEKTLTRQLSVRSEDLELAKGVLSRYHVKPEDIHEIVVLIRSGRMIEAIKNIRSATGLELKPSKDIAQKLQKALVP